MIKYERMKSERLNIWSVLLKLTWWYTKRADQRTCKPAIGLRFVDDRDSVGGCVLSCWKKAVYLFLPHGTMKSSADNQSNSFARIRHQDSCSQRASLAMIFKLAQSAST